MLQLDHPNIVKYFETYDDEKYIYLCMELLTGGELIETVIKQETGFPELQAAVVFESLLEALHHCHT